MTELQEKKCEFCGKTVEHRYVGYEPHKGYHTTRRETIYPFEKRTFEFPEGRAWNVVVCQDCNDKPTSKWIHELRIKKVEKEIESAVSKRLSRKAKIERLKIEIEELEEIKNELESYLNTLVTKGNSDKSWNEVCIPDKFKGI